MSFYTAHQHNRYEFLWIILIILFIITPSNHVAAKEASDSVATRSSFFLKLSGEGEKLNIQTSILNPSNIIGLYENRIESYMLTGCNLKMLGGNTEVEMRLGYQNLTGDQDNSFSKRNYNNQINKLFYQFASGPISISAGRNKIRWGVGYSYSPTDLITQFKTPQDPDDRLCLNKGNDLIQLSYIHSSGQLDLVYIPNVSSDYSMDLIKNYRVGMRLYQYIDPFDLSLVGKIENDCKYSIGSNASVTIGNSLELHAEYLYQSYNNRLYPNPDIAPDQPFYPYFIQNNKVVHDAVFGGQYTFNNKINLTIEYLYNSLGYTSAQFNSYTDRLIYLNNQLLSSPQVALTGLSETAANYNIPMSRDHLFARLYHPEIIKALSIESYFLFSLNDKSGFIVVSPKYESSSQSQIYLRLQKFWGNRHSELGMIPNSLSAILGITFFITK
jgi:hypothetical protein